MGLNKIFCFRCFLFVFSVFLWYNLSSEKGISDNRGWKSGNDFKHDFRLSDLLVDDRQTNQKAKTNRP